MGPYGLALTDRAADLCDPRDRGGDPVIRSVIGHNRPSELGRALIRWEGGEEGENATVPDPPPCSSQDYPKIR